MKQACFCVANVSKNKFRYKQKDAKDKPAHAMKPATPNEQSIAGFFGMLNSCGNNDQK